MSDNSRLKYIRGSIGLVSYTAVLGYSKAFFRVPNTLFEMTGGSAIAKNKHWHSSEPVSD
jgi:hypothetical protein